jgi:hypothetical protein
VTRNLQLACSASFVRFGRCVSVTFVEIPIDIGVKGSVPFSCRHISRAIKRR